MNKHLKPGVAVDVRGASDEVKEQVMAAFFDAGAKRSRSHGQSIPSLQKCAFWDDENGVSFSSEMRGTIISISQALGRDSEVDCSVAKTRDSIAEMHKGVNALAESLIENTWFERGELPPAGTVCEIASSTEHLNISYPEGSEVKVYSNFTDDRGVELAAFVCPKGKIGGVATAKCFRPLKTEKDKFVERFISEVHEFGDLAGVFYDKGLRFTD